MSLLWVRDNYDTDKSRYIEDDELAVASSDWLDDRITSDEYHEVIAANNSHILLPSYGTPTPPPDTPASLLWVRDNYDTDKSRYIEEDERKIAFSDWLAERITPSEYSAVLDAHSSHTLLPPYGTPAMGVISINIPSRATLKVDGVTII